MLHCRDKSKCFSVIIPKSSQKDFTIVILCSEVEIRVGIFILLQFSPCKDNITALYVVKCGFILL